MDKVSLNEYREMFQQLLGGSPMEERVIMDGMEGGDEIDFVTTEKTRQLELRLLSRNHVYLKKVRHALERINAGVFGECEECGAEIGASRLAARPTATLCIHCKEEEERGEKALVHGNRHSLKHQSNVFPIDAKKRWGTQEDRLGSFSVTPGEPGGESDTSAG